MRKKQFQFTKKPEKKTEGTRFLWTEYPYYFSRNIDIFGNMYKKPYFQSDLKITSFAISSHSDHKKPSFYEQKNDFFKVFSKELPLFQILILSVILIVLLVEMLTLSEL